MTDRRRGLISRTISAIAIVVLFGSAAWADCSTDNSPTCQYVAAGSTNVQVIPPASINPNPACAFITNGCGQDVMVPFASQAEWNNFVTSNFYNPGSHHCAVVSAC
jgi:hypothetical protein